MANFWDAAPVVQGGKPKGNFWDAAPLAEEKPLNWSDVPGEMLRNAPSDAYEVASGIAGMVRHPVDTASNLNDVLKGAIAQSKTLQEANSFLAKHGLAIKRNLEAEAASPEVQKATAVGEGLKKSYGSVEGFKRQLAEHPIGTAMDASLVLGAPEAALARVPLKVAQTASKVIGKTANVLNPINVVTAPVKAITNRLASNSIIKDAGKTAATLKQASTEAYRVAEETAGKQKMTAQEFAAVVRGFAKEARAKNLGGALSETTDKLYSGSKAVLRDTAKILTGIIKGERPPPTFGELEGMRQSLRDLVRGEVNIKGEMSPDGRLASRFIDQIDDAVGKTPFKDARDAYRTLRKTQRIEEAIHNAEEARSSLDLAYKGEFKKIVKENYRKPMFSPSEMAAIRQVAGHGRINNLLEGLGRAGYSSKSITAGNVAGGVAAGLAASFGLDPVTAFALTTGTTSTAKAIGTKITKNAATRARDIVAQGGDNAALDARLSGAKSTIDTTVRAAGKTANIADAPQRGGRKPLRLANGSVYWNPAPAEYKRLIEQEGATPLTR